MDTAEHFFLLYCSDLARKAPLSCIGDIARMARPRNFKDHISGLLAFDGISFAQFVEGPANAISDLLQRLRADARHVRLEVLSLDPLQGARRFPSWRLGYLIVDSDDGGIDRLRGLRGPEAVLMFDAMLPELDVGIGHAVPA